jgi:hypothetical protein
MCETYETVIKLKRQMNLKQLAAVGIYASIPFGCAMPQTEVHTHPLWMASAEKR